MKTMNILTISDLKKIRSVIKWNVFWDIFFYLIFNYGQDHLPLAPNIHIDRYTSHLRDCIFNEDMKIEFIFSIPTRPAHALRKINIEQETAMVFKKYPKLFNRMPEHIINKIMMLSI